MNLITITVTAPKGQARSNLAKLVLDSLRASGFQVGLSDPTPDFNMSPGATFRMDTRIQVVSREDESAPTPVPVAPDPVALIAKELEEVKARLASLDLKSTSQLTSLDLNNVPVPENK